MPDEPVPDDAAGLRAANARLRALLAERDGQIAVLRGHLGELAALQEEAAGLRERAAGLEAQVADLAARLAQNSQNSSRPPSSDGLAKPAPKSLRAKSGRKPGRPKGQPGATMQLADDPDRRVRHVPACCAGCGESLKGAAETGMERRQVTDIKPVEAEVTEHQLVELSAAAAGRGRRARPRGA